MLREVNQNYHLSGIKNETLTLEETLGYLEQEIQTSGANKVIFIGRNEGGFSAILYGKLLDVDIAVGIDSPYSLLEKRLKKINDKRFSSSSKLQNAYKKYLDLNKIHSKKTNVHLYFSDEKYVKNVPNKANIMKFKHTNFNLNLYYRWQC